MLGNTSFSEISVGDQFVRVEVPDTVWTVRRVVELAKLPKHAVMTCEVPAYRRIFVSAAVLRDRRMYRPVRGSAVASRIEAAAASRIGLRWLFGR
jgi:hypothetical protein